MQICCLVALLISSEDLTAARRDHEPEEPGLTVSTMVALLCNPPCLSAAKADGSRDIWVDEPTMQFLRTGQHVEGLTTAQRERVQQRSRRYYWRDDYMIRVLPTGAERLVPPPHERAALIHRVHDDLGHFGIKRTYSLLVPHFHWKGMYLQVRDVVMKCEQCDRVKASFTQDTAEVHPLPIQGLFYRWSCDLLGDLPPTPRWNVYVMVIVEHFSKWMELIALPDKTSRSTSQAFLHAVLSRFGSCAEVLIDQGTEFRGEFQDLLDQALIDHRRTSRDHPQANGMAERIVQTAKVGLRKLCLQHGKSDWDLMLPYIAMGYRMSRHASLGHFSPYFLLFGRDPVPTSALKAVMETPVDLDDPAVWARVIAERAALLRRVMHAHGHG